MKHIFSVLLLGALVAAFGCNQGTSGGPGASLPDSEQATLGQTDNTFSLDTPMMSTKLTQGETVAVTIGITRGKNFDQDVTLMFNDLPKGVTVDPMEPVIKHGDADAKMTMKAADDAALGDFTIKLMGHPATGGAAEAEMSITVAKQDSPDDASTASEAVHEEWEEYTMALQKDLDQFTAKFAELKERAATAEGQAKTDLDIKLEEAKTKLDTASIKLDELKSASADRWEKVKEGVGNAFDDLKTIFE